MKILIAEDDLTSRSMLAAVLKRNGHEVIEACDGSEAWSILNNPEAPRLAIIDWMMPEMDGLEVIRRAKERHEGPSTYLVMLTARGEKADVLSGFEAGADDYLTKPFEVSELLARVRVGRRMIEIQDRLSKQVQELREALAHIKTLQGIIPICCFCKKIRNDDGFWDRVEAYVSDHSEAEFSHSVCPDCMEKHYPEVCGQSRRVKQI